MNEERDLKIAEKVVRDTTKLDIQPSVGEAWLLLSAIQFATRAPGIRQEFIEVLTKVGRKYQRKIGALHPEAEQILEAGWYASRDR